MKPKLVEIDGYKKAAADMAEKVRKRDIDAARVELNQVIDLHEATAFNEMTSDAALRLRDKARELVATMQRLPKRVGF